MGKSLFETIMGALVLIVAFAFMSFAYESSNMKPVKGYPLTAKFTTVAGIGLGTDVRIGGIKIGVVTDMALDPESYRAKITMQIKEGIKIPTDSNAAVVSDGLLGSKYVKIEPGADETMLAAGGLITLTQSSVSFEDIISKFAFGSVDSSKGKKKDAGDTATTATTPSSPEIKKP